MSDRTAWPPAPDSATTPLPSSSPSSRSSSRRPRIPLRHSPRISTRPPRTCDFSSLYCPTHHTNLQPQPIALSERRGPESPRPHRRPQASGPTRNRTPLRWTRARGGGPPDPLHNQGRRSAAAAGGPLPRQGRLATLARPRSAALRSRSAPPSTAPLGAACPLPPTPLAARPPLRLGVCVCGRLASRGGGGRQRVCSPPPPPHTQKTNANNL